MTRFLYMADTHLGANPMGYQQQRGCPEKLPEILSALCDYLLSTAKVDFILHGGDMIDSATDANILAAVDTFDLPIPTYLCLGNHDLTTPGAVSRWMELAPDFFINGQPDYSMTTCDCVIHVAPNQWGDRDYYWKDTQQAHFSSAQYERLSHELSVKPNFPHILLTHSPVYGLPELQTGMTAPYHAPDASFTSEITALNTAHPHLTTVLGAHNHMNMCVKKYGVEFVTASSLSETPFEFKIFEVTSKHIEMTTGSLQASLAFDGDYDPSKSFVQGRKIDRSFSRALN